MAPGMARAGFLLLRAAVCQVQYSERYSMQARVCSFLLQ
jgi:hypothetical protein